MESRLDEVGEKIEELENLPEGRLKAVVMIVILLITLATTAGILLAAKAASHESLAQRDRQQMSAQAVADGVQAATATAMIGQQSDNGTEANWRQFYLDFLASNSNLPAEATSQLQAEATAAGVQGRIANAGLPAHTAQLPNYEANLEVGADVDRQTAQARASQSNQWLGKEDAALSTLSMLALGLFLLGLALTINNHSTAKGFVALAVALLAVSVGRLTDVAVSGVSAPSTRAIAAYGSADTRAYVGDYTGAAHLLQTAVYISPDYEQAWEQLANDEYSEGTRTGYSAFERDLGRALALHPSSTQKAVLFTDLGFTQLLDGQFEAAGVTLHHALTFDPTNEVALANLSLQRMLVGDRAGADMYFNMALAHVASHGPYFREQYFAGYRHGQQTFDQVGIRNPVFDAFYMRMKEAEASLDALGQPAPGDSHGASVSHVVLRPVSGPGGQSLATVAFDYRGFQVGDHLSVRWYSQGTYYDVAESLPDFKLDASFAGSGTLLPDNMGVPTLPGSHTVEIYLNGVLLGSSTFTMPTPGA